MNYFDKILITNDDGFDAPGIKVLRSLLSSFSQEIYTVAPSSNQSGTGRSISLNTEINFKKLSKFEWKIHGTPTDCIIFALNSIFEKSKPNLILSGINLGSNVGDEISYSGTVGAAFEGALRGIPSIALSQANWSKSNKFEVSEFFFPHIFKNVIKMFKKDKLLFNINFPDCQISEVREMVLADCCHQKISDDIYLDNAKNFFKIGVMNVKKVLLPSTDLVALKKNKISVSPLLINFSNKSKLS